MMLTAVGGSFTIALHPALATRGTFWFAPLLGVLLLAVVGLLTAAVLLRRRRRRGPE